MLFLVIVVVSHIEGANLIGEKQELDKWNDMQEEVYSLLYDTTNQGLYCYFEVLAVVVPEKCLTEIYWEKEKLDKHF